MTDARLRELERRWRQTDAVDDEVAFLRERLRVGDLAEERARLAAWLGHLAAERVTGAGFEPRDRARDALAGHAQSPELIQAALARWGDGLVELGREVARRTALADGRRCVKTIAADLAGPDDTPGADEARAATVRSCWTRLDAHAAFAVDPTDSRRAEAVAAWRSNAGAQPRHLLLVRSDAARQASTDLMAVSLSLLGDLEDDPIAWWHQVRPLEEADAAARYHAIRDAIRAEVVPWALGWTDPLRDLGARALASLFDDPLDALEVASPCGADWSTMRLLDPAGRARACDACQHNVYDLSALTRDDATALLHAHEGERLCVRFLRREDGRVLTRDCPVGLAARLERGSPPRPTMGIRLPTRR